MVQEVILTSDQWTALLQHISNIGFFLGGIVLALIVAATWKG